MYKKLTSKSITSKKTGGQAGRVKLAGKNAKRSKPSYKSKSYRTVLLIGSLLIATGLFLAGYELFNTWRAEKSAAASVPLAVALGNNKPGDNGKPEIKGKPTHISIPSVDISLKVIPGYYYPASNSWTLTLNDAQWGTMTRQANNKGGATFIYAHYRPGVFLTLPKVQPGAKAVVKTANGHTFTYVFRSSTITKPEDTSIFDYEGKPVLILQTCTGVWFQNRQLFVFDLKKAE